MPSTWIDGGSAIADATGSATVRINGPRRMGTRVQLGQVIIKSTATGSGALPQAALYISQIIRSQLIGESRAADKVTFEGLDGDELHQGDTLIAVITGALVGSTVTVNARGVELPA